MHYLKYIIFKKKIPIVKKMPRYYGNYFLNELKGRIVEYLLRGFLIPLENYVKTLQCYYTIK